MFWRCFTDYEIKQAGFAETFMHLLKTKTEKVISHDYEAPI